MAGEGREFEVVVKPADPASGTWDGPVGEVVVTSTKDFVFDSRATVVSWEHFEGMRLFSAPDLPRGMVITNGDAVYCQDVERFKNRWIMVRWIHKRVAETWAELTRRMGRVELNAEDWFEDQRARGRDMRGWWEKPIMTGSDGRPVGIGEGNRVLGAVLRDGKTGEVLFDFGAAIAEEFNRPARREGMITWADDD